jgi:hypothetical protein
MGFAVFAAVDFGDVEVDVIGESHVRWCYYRVLGVWRVVSDVVFEPVRGLQF